MLWKSEKLIDDLVLPMTKATKYLPENLLGKTAGSLSNEPDLFSDDVVALSGSRLNISKFTNGDLLEHVDYFLLDARDLMGPEYLNLVGSALSNYKDIASDRYLYAAIPYKKLNYQWDVYNEMAPYGDDDASPGVRFIYDNLLVDFSVRAIGNMDLERDTACIIVRLQPLKPTIVCVMAASGQGKTTFVRQLKRSTGSFHISSDYLLSEIIKLKNSNDHSQQIKTIKTTIETIEPDQIWSHFFRIVEEDDSLLWAFLEIISSQLQAVNDQLFFSFDIDVRMQKTVLKIKSFFEEKQMKVWTCQP